MKFSFHAVTHCRQMFLYWNIYDVGPARFYCECLSSGYEDLNIEVAIRKQEQDVTNIPEAVIEALTIKLNGLV